MNMTVSTNRTILTSWTNCKLLRWLVMIPCLVLFACDTFMTEAPTEGNDFETPFDGLSHNLNAQFLEGDDNFERAFTIEDGLGPIFNNVGCEGCHPGDGRGTSDLGFFRFSRGSDLVDSEGGPQHQDKAISGVPLETIPAGVDRSFRMPPPVFGVGLIEAIPEATILALAEEQSADVGTENDDGIAGRPNWVFADTYVSDAYVGGGSGQVLGRFSRKAQVSSLLQQVTEAYHEDIGITSDFKPEENPHPQAGSVAAGDQVPDPEISASTVLETVMYVRLLHPPARGEITAQVQQGDGLFSEIGCATCHVPILWTGANAIPQLDQQPAFIYSDLLLHDMGDALADNRPDGDATGTEWRTAPLWGTRLVGEFLNGGEFYLHDGRARSLHDAIVLHGGEAQGSTDRYNSLGASEQEALIAFLKSL